MNYYNEHTLSGWVLVPLGGSPATSIITTIPSLAGNLLSVVIQRLESQGATIPDVFFRIVSRGHILIPENGGYIVAPAGAGVLLEIPVGKKLEGPPWEVGIEFYNAGIVDKRFSFIFTVGDLYEADTQVQILRTLERILGIVSGTPEPIKAKDWSGAKDL